MYKISQKEILCEGFLDNIRKIASPIAKTIASAAGAAKGIAKVAAPKLSEEIGSDIDKLKSIGKGAKDAFTAEKNKQINSTPGRFVENELKSKWNNIFNPQSIKIISTQKDAKIDISKSIQPTAANRTFVYFEAEKYKPTTGNSEQQTGGVEYKEKFVATITKGVKGFSILEIKDSKGIPVKGISQLPPKDNATQPAPAVVDKPKFYESLRAWKIKNIGPSAEKVGLTYQQLKQFLQSIDIQDPDRVLKNAGAKDSGAGIVSNSILSTIESTLKSRGIVAEKTQINLLKQLNLLNDSYNKKYELPKH